MTSGDQAGSELIEQIVYRAESGRGMSPDYYTMPQRDCYQLIKELNLARLIFADPDPELSGCVNLHYSVYGEAGRHAILVYRDSVVAGTRNSSLAHVLIGPSDTLSPGNVVPMLQRWPWRSSVARETNLLEPITCGDFRAMAESMREGLSEAPSAASDRLLIERVCVGAADLVVKVRPELRATLIQELYRSLGEESLRRGFSFQETAYDDKQTLPGLTFVSKWVRSNISASRHQVDLDELPAGESRRLGSLAGLLREGFLTGRVPNVLDQEVTGVKEQVTVGQLLQQSGFRLPAHPGLPSERLSPPLVPPPPPTVPNPTSPPTPPPAVPTTSPEPIQAKENPRSGPDVTGEPDSEFAQAIDMGNSGRLPTAPSEPSPPVGAAVDTESVRQPPQTHPDGDPGDPNTIPVQVVAAPPPPADAQQRPSAAYQPSQSQPQPPVHQPRTDPREHQPPNSEPLGATVDLFFLVTMLIMVIIAAVPFLVLGRVQ